MQEINRCHKIFIFTQLSRFLNVYSKFGIPLCILLNKFIWSKVCHVGTGQKMFKLLSKNVAGLPTKDENSETVVQIANSSNEIIYMGMCVLDE